MKRKKPSKRIPIATAKRIADEHGQKQVIVVTFGDDGITHVVTYGKSVEDCDQAAIGGNFVKRALGWPDELCHAESSRVKRMRGEIAHLNEELRATNEEIVQFLDEKRTLQEEAP